MSLLMDALKRAEKARQAQAETAAVPGSESEAGQEPELSLDPLDQSQLLKAVEAPVAVDPLAEMDLSLEATDNGSSPAIDEIAASAHAGDAPGREPGSDSRTDEDSMSMDFGELSLDDTSATLPSMKSAQRSVDDYFDGTHSMSMSMDRVRTALEEEVVAESGLDHLAGTRSDATTQQTARAVFDAKAVAPPRSGRVAALVVLPLLLLALMSGIGFVYWDQLLEIVYVKPVRIAKRPPQPAPAAPPAATPATREAEQSQTAQSAPAAGTAVVQAGQQTSQSVAVAQAPQPEASAQPDNSQQPPSGTLMAANAESAAAEPVAETPPVKAPDTPVATEAEAETSQTVGDKLQAMADQALSEVMPATSVDLSAQLRKLEPAGTARRGPITFRVNRNRHVDRVHKDLLQAYAAFQKGLNDQAMAAYRKVLKRRPQDRDALLGVAAIEMRAGNLQQATAIYYRLLSANPRDALVQSALISLREDVDPVAGESTIKILIRDHPGAANLHFNLGNLFARQLRWSEAQQAYFDAYRLDVGNPDYAYNLAISLDHLSKPRQAMQFYQLAVDLTDTQPAGFQQADALQRIAMINAAQ